VYTPLFPNTIYSVNKYGRMTTNNNSFAKKPLDLVQTGCIPNIEIETQIQVEEVELKSESENDEYEKDDE